MFCHRKRVGRARVRMTLHLDERRHRQPRSIGFIAPQARRQIKDASNDREISIDCARASTIVEPGPDVGCERVLVYPPKRERADEAVQHGQCPPITLDAALVLILREKLRGCFAKVVLALLTEEMNLAGLGYPSRQKRLGLRKISGPGALTNPLAVYDLVDVPNATPKE